jgi:hypothetical protein
MFSDAIIENIQSLLVWFGLTALIIVFFAGINQIIDWIAGK